MYTIATTRTPGRHNVAGTVPQHLGSFLSPVQVLRFIRALRVLVFSIIHTMRSLVWSLVLLLVIMYSFGILFLSVETDPM